MPKLCEDCKSVYTDNPAYKYCKQCYNRHVKNGDIIPKKTRGKPYAAH